MIMAMGKFRLAGLVGGFRVFLGSSTETQSG